MSDEGLSIKKDTSQKDTRRPNNTEPAINKIYKGLLVCQQEFRIKDNREQKSNNSARIGCIWGHNSDEIAKLILLVVEAICDPFPSPLEHGDPKRDLPEKSIVSEYLSRKTVAG